jgi:hypothetical protein
LLLPVALSLSGKVRLTAGLGSRPCELGPSRSGSACGGGSTSASSSGGSTASNRRADCNDGPSDVGCSRRRSTAKATCSVRSSPSRGELSPLRLALVGGMSRVALCCVVDMIWIIVKHLVDFDRFRRSSSFTLPLPVPVFIAEKPPCGGLTTYTQPRCTRDHPLAPEEHLLPPLVRVL